MITPVKFETAKLAKEKGFNLISTTNNYYSPEGVLDGLWGSSGYYACTQTLLQKWLREVHNIDVLIDSVGGKHGYYHILQFVNSGDNINSDYNYTTYEKALELGLYQALKLIP